MPRKVSVTQKKEILEKYQKGSSIKDLSLYFNFSKQTITKQLKTLMGEEEFRKFKYLKVDKTKRLEKKSLNLNHSNTLENSKKSIINNQSLKNVSESTYDNSENFFEIPPLIENIDLEKQKDISSRPISEFVFPKIVYLLVDKNIELETKYLRDFPEWQFLSSDELNRKTIQIFDDLKNAKRFCNKEQKVIKVPNTDVFKIVAPILVSRGISRMVSGDKLIAL